MPKIQDLCKIHLVLSVDSYLKDLKPPLLIFQEYSVYGQYLLKASRFQPPKCFGKQRKDTTAAAEMCLLGVMGKMATGMCLQLTSVFLLTFLTLLTVLSFSPAQEQWSSFWTLRLISSEHYHAGCIHIFSSAFNFSPYWYPNLNWRTLLLYTPDVASSSSLLPPSQFFLATVKRPSGEFSGLTTWEAILIPFLFLFSHSTTWLFLWRDFQQLPYWVPWKLNNL